MNSPIARDVEMEKVELIDGLVAYKCPKSHGHYISLQNYWSWLNQQPERLAQLPCKGASVPEEVEPTSAKICPESGTIMLRYKLGHGFKFTIDRSVTGGVWFDQGEWEALLERQFHDEIHLVFTAPWQDSVRHEASDAMYQSLLEERFGDALFTELKLMRAKLSEHPHREFALAYLNLEKGEE